MLIYQDVVVTGNVKLTRYDIESFFVVVNFLFYFVDFNKLLLVVALVSFITLYGREVVFDISTVNYFELGISKFIQSRIFPKNI